MLYFVKGTQSGKAIVVSDKPRTTETLKINGKDVSFTKIDPTSRAGFAAIPTSVVEGLKPGDPIEGSEALKIGDNHVMRTVTNPDGSTEQEELKNLFWVEVA